MARGGGGAACENLSCRGGGLNSVCGPPASVSRPWVPLAAPGRPSPPLTASLYSPDTRIPNLSSTSDMFNFTERERDSVPNLSTLQIPFQKPVRRTWTHLSRFYRFVTINFTSFNSLMYVPFQLRNESLISIYYVL